MEATKIKILKFIDSKQLDYASITQVTDFFDETDSTVIRNLLGELQLDRYLKFTMGHYIITQVGRDAARNRVWIY